MAVYDEDTYTNVIAAAQADLVTSVGTADGTIADVGAAFNQTTLNNNFKDVATAINGILAVLRTANFIAKD